MADIIKNTINKILSLFHVSKIHSKLYDMEKEAEQVALLGEINTENINPYCEPTKQFQEDCKDIFANIKKEDTKLYIDSKQAKGSE